MFCILKVYRLSCNNSCAESSSPFEQDKNWFLKKRLTANLSSVDWCKVFERPKIKFEEKLARLSSKTSNIHSTKRWSFPLGTFLVNVSKSTVLCGYVHIYQINCKWKSSFLCCEYYQFYYWVLHWFGQVNRPKTTVKKNYFWKIVLLIYSHFSKKSLQFANFLPSTVLASFSSQGEYVLI